MKNLPKKFRLYVSKKDIKNGERGEATSCPIALALKRKFKTENVSVGGSDDITINNILFTDGQRVSEFVRDFDNGADVSPTRLTLTRDDE